MHPLYMKLFISNWTWEFLLYFFTHYRLTGTPSALVWPAELAISRDNFPQRLPKRPVDLCPELDEYANDLLTVSKSHWIFSNFWIIFFFLFFSSENVSIWSNQTAISCQLFKSHIFYTGTAVAFDNNSKTITNYHVMGVVPKNMPSVWLINYLILHRLVQ